MNNIILATSNKAKIKYFNTLFKNYPIETVELPDNLKLDIKEDLFDIVGNAVKKATTYARTTKSPAIGDDTGFFLPALNNMPGVAVRRWGGELPDTVSDSEWLTFFKDKIKDLKNEELICIRKKVFCIALPTGEYKTFTNELEGIIVDNPNPVYEQGGPLGAHFYVKKFNKILSELLDEGLSDQQLTTDLEKILKEFKLLD